MRLRIRFAGDFFHAHEMLVWRQAAFVRQWKVQRVINGCNGLVCFAHVTRGEQLLIFAARAFLHAEHNHARGAAINAMNGNKRVNAQLALQSHK